MAVSVSRSSSLFSFMLMLMRSRLSHRFAHSDDLVAVGAGVLLVIAGGDAEWNQAAAEPASDETKNEAEDPAKSAFLLIHVSHASVTAVLALDCDWMVWPVARRICTATLGTALDNDNLSTWLSHHWLAWNGLGSVLWLSHGLRSVLWLLWRDKRLLFGLTCRDTVINCCFAHIAFVFYLFFLL